MSDIKNVAIAGAAGNLGTVILSTLVSSGKFNITILTRIGSTSKFPLGITVVPVDYESAESLKAALTGIDAVVATIGSIAVATQITLIDAAIAAGVKRFLPSEFGSDIGNPLTRRLPIFAPKVAVEARLEEAAKTNPEFTYTLVRTAAFLDWGLNAGFFFNARIRNPTIYDGGDVEFSATSLATIGDAVVGVLTHPAETKNRAVYVQDLVLTQNKLLALAKSLTPGETWEPEQVKISDLTAKSDEALAKGLFEPQYLFPYIFASLLSEGYGGKLEKLDNELLGLKGKTEADVIELLKPLLAPAA